MYLYVLFPITVLEKTKKKNNMKMLLKRLICSPECNFFWMDNALYKALMGMPIITLLIRNKIYSDEKLDPL